MFKMTQPSYSLGYIKVQMQNKLISLLHLIFFASFGERFLFLIRFVIDVLQSFLQLCFDVT